MPNKILVIRLSSLGDVILTAPVFRSLKAHWPDCSISVLVKPQFAAALEANPHVDEIIPFLGFSDALRRVRQGGFSHLLDLHATLRSLLIRRLSGVAEVSVYGKDALARRLFVAFGLRTPALEKHTVDKYLAALAPWGVLAGDTGLRLEDLRQAPAPEAPPEACRVLLIQSAFLGDTLLTVPLARDLKARLPGCRLTVLTLESASEIFRGTPWVDRLIFDHKRGEHGGILGTLRLCALLRREGFDLAVIPHRSLRSALLAWLSGIPRRIGFSSSAGRILLTDAVPFTWLMHDLERNLALLQPLSPSAGPGPGESVYLSADDGARRLIDERLRSEGIAPGQKLVGVHPGSAWPTKRWLSGRFSELCRRFLARELRVVLIGGSQDASLCGRIAAESGALDWSGKTDLNELKALMPRLSLFVTNDSGPMHLAAACGVPTLAVFGPTTRELGFFPYGEAHRVLEADLPCRPCGLHGAKACPEGHFLCMKLITTDEVWKSALEMLEEKKRFAVGEAQPPPPAGAAEPWGGQ